MTPLAELVTNPWFQALGFVFGLLGIVLAVHFHRKSRRVHLLAFQHERTTLVQGLRSQFEQLSLHYADRPIENVSVSVFKIWNAGTETLRGADIAPADSLRIEATDGVDLLDTQLLKSTTPAIRFHVDYRERRRLAHLKFDYLDPGDGATVQVVHTGVADGALAVRGTLMAAGTPRELSELQPLRRTRRMARALWSRPYLFLALALGFSVITIVGSAIFIANCGCGSPEPGVGMKTAISMAASMTVPIVVLFTPSWIRRFIWKRPPRALDG